MNSNLLVERILRAGAALESSVGVVLLVQPSAVSSLLLESPLVGPGLAFGRLAGGGLLGLGIACWHARGSVSSPAGLGAARAFLAYNVVASAILILARPPLPGGVLALGASAAHGLLGLLLLYALFGPGRVRSDP
jgi:hypothetical protein